MTTMTDALDLTQLAVLQRLDEKLDRVIDDVRDLQRRMSSVEESLIGFQRVLDRVEMRLDRIERRELMPERDFSRIAR